ncbi:hypothetical protein BDA99DRAFT_568240 [Phascolomyces articulosus]|uniref:Uncharacterized protein n=1 Tax=Phascolomyces articulosus TaxID=60185 RepID=A0AAD5KMJ8_9FUNG|nr:hypothetical protein BDA99DRAFT_568240 [Phascolomyces articulosus]
MIEVRTYCKSTQCFENKENYIETCRSHDFTCSCKRNMAKLSYWDNCPSDSGHAAQSRVVESFCANPQKKKVMQLLYYVMVESQKQAMLLLSCLVCLLPGAFVTFFETLL